ncbi:hypothetical protein [Candidatus Liberibacter africanus]|uniref:Uncharacterized protein n=1 Tax=Candidatus Liberibacter africanus PTSAPSY TaxID=1277257 RepID=A0A0G3I8J0_LIBAF|nr:hypothetical protein [Candidatus Liberibacter africanus]AKK20052.1 hypothetical protein G293_02100 [Candidatus Liberibacter africanus PTSAPSY]
MSSVVSLLVGSQENASSEDVVGMVVPISILSYSIEDTFGKLCVRSTAIVGSALGVGVAKKNNSWNAAHEGSSVFAKYQGNIGTRYNLTFARNYLSEIGIDASVRADINIIPHLSSSLSYVISPYVNITSKLSTGLKFVGSITDSTESPGSEIIDRLTPISAYIKYDFTDRLSAYSSVAMRILDDRGAAMTSAISVRYSF